MAGLWGTLLHLSVFRTIDVGAPKDFGIKFLNLECEFLRHEMCSERGSLRLTQMTLGGATLWNSARKIATPQAPRVPFSQGPSHYILQSPPQMKCKQSYRQLCSGPGQGPSPKPPCWQQQCHSPTRHLLCHQKPPYAISLSELTQIVRKRCPRSTWQPHDNSQKLQTGLGMVSGFFLCCPPTLV